MAEFNKELLEKAKQANSPEELLALAKENNVELTQEQAEAFFEKMNKSGELSNEELANVAGGLNYRELTDEPPIIVPSEPQPGC